MTQAHGKLYTLSRPTQGTTIIRALGNAHGWAALSDAEPGATLLPRRKLLPDTAHLTSTAT